MGDDGTALHFNPVLHKDDVSAENIEWMHDVVFSEVAARGGNIVSEHTVRTKLVKYDEKYNPEGHLQTAMKIARLDPQNLFNRGVSCSHETVLEAAAQIAYEKN